MTGNSGKPFDFQNSFSRNAAMIPSRHRGFIQTRQFRQIGEP